MGAFVCASSTNMSRAKILTSPAVKLTKICVLYADFTLMISTFLFVLFCLFLSLFFGPLLVL